MASQQQTEGSSLSSTVEGIVSDVQRLIEQQFKLLREDFKGELAKAGDAALSMGAGAGLVATSGILSTLMLVELLHSATGLPRWLSYGVVAGGLGAAGVALLSSGAAQAADVQLLPQQAAEKVKEGVTAVRERVMA